MGRTLQELPESQINIVRNRDAIVGWLKELGAAQRRRLLEFHEEAINVVVISASTLDEARNAHASTQTRGLVQAETDKLKSEFIGDCPPSDCVRALPGIGKTARQILVETISPPCSAI